MTLNNALSDLIGKVLNDTSNGNSVVTIQISKDNTESKMTSSVNISIETPRDTPKISVTKVPEIDDVKLTQELPELKNLVTKKEEKVVVRPAVDAYDASKTSNCESLVGTVNANGTIFCNIDNNKVNDDDIDVSGIYDKQIDKLHKYRNELRDEVGYSNTIPSYLHPEFDVDNATDIMYKRFTLAKDPKETTYEQMRNKHLKTPATSTEYISLKHGSVNEIKGFVASDPDKITTSTEHNTLKPWSVSEIKGFVASDPDKITTSTTEQIKDIRTTPRISSSEPHTSRPWCVANIELDASDPVTKITPLDNDLNNKLIERENDDGKNWLQSCKKDTEIKPHIVIEMGDVDILPSGVASDTDEVNSVHSSEYEIMSDSDPNMLD